MHRSDLVSAAGCRLRRRRLSDLLHCCWKSCKNFALQSLTIKQQSLSEYLLAIWMKCLTIFARLAMFCSLQTSVTTQNISSFDSWNTSRHVTSRHVTSHHITSHHWLYCSITLDKPFAGPATTNFLCFGDWRNHGRLAKQWPEVAAIAAVLYCALTHSL